MNTHALPFPRSRSLNDSLPSLLLLPLDFESASLLLDPGLTQPLSLPSLRFRRSRALSASSSVRRLRLCIFRGSERDECEEASKPGWGKS